MPIENHSSNGDLSSCGSDSYHRDIVSGASGAAVADAALTGAQRSSSMSETGDAQQIRAMPSAGGSMGSGE
jgi:hypothetical protein